MRLLPKDSGYKAFTKTYDEAEDCQAIGSMTTANTFRPLFSQRRGRLYPLPHSYPVANLQTDRVQAH